MEAPEPLNDVVETGSATLDITYDYGFSKDTDEESIDGGNPHIALSSALTDIRRKNGELSVYTYYLSSSGYTTVTLYAILVSLWVFCTEFPSK
jgi:hypothetical protein